MRSLINILMTGCVSAVRLGSGSATISNTQCTVFGGASAVSVSGNVVTLTLSVAFASGFTGNKVIYLAARDLVEASNGWKTIGTALIPVAKRVILPLWARLTGKQKAAH